MPIPFLPAVIAAFTLANSANYWHGQLKPFKSEQERIQALKEQLAESPFVAYWNANDKKQLVADSRFLGVKHDSSDLFAVSLGLFPSWHEDYNTKYILYIENPDFFTIKNRYELRKLCARNAPALGHEGAHIAQGIKKIHQEPENRKFFESDADLKGLIATIEDHNLTAYEKYDATLEKKSVHLKYHQKYCLGSHKNPLCEGNLEYQSCQERIDITKKYIAHARLEIINDTIREEIAWQ